MKKLFLFLCLSISILSIGQTEKKEEDSKKYAGYVSAGLSITNSNDFVASSYPSLEVGIMAKNISGGLILGRGSLKGLGEKTDAINNYFYEAKSSVFTSISNSTTVYGIFGIGNYMDTKHIFIEYGAGFSYTHKKMSYFVQASNWDGLWYVTPGVTFNF